MAALVLTRTVGLVVVAAYAIWALIQRDVPPAARARALLPALAVASAYAAWALLRPPGITDNYTAIVIERAQDD